MAFTINIIAGSDSASSSVTVRGEDRHIITDTERTTFKLNDSQLKDAVKNYMGKKPDDAYLHSPTKHDLYNTYSWPETYTTIRGTKAEIISVTSESVMLKQQRFVNNSSVTATYNVAISDTVTNTSATNWDMGGQLTAEQKITYQVGVLGTSGGGETTMSYSDMWGTTESLSEQVTFGSSSSVTVTLDPGQSVIATLSASKGLMNIRVSYNASLDGYTAVNYSKAYEGHHFYGIWLPSVMAYSSISNKVPSEQFINLDYYSNGVIELTDPATNELVSRRCLF